MITPLQQSAGLAGTTLLQSILDRKDEQRLEEEKKAKGTSPSQSEAMLEARLAASQSHAVLNDKINAHFFGAQKVESDPLAKLVSRLTRQLNLVRGEGDTDAVFAQKFQDRLQLLDSLTKSEATAKDATVTLARFDITVDGLKSVLDGSNVKPKDQEAWMARLVTDEGISQDSTESDAAYSARIGENLRGIRAKMADGNRDDLAKTSGLDDLGVTFDDLIAAIKNPHGEEAKKITKALDEQARDDKVLTPQVQKALQRMGDIAHPKTKAELLLERDGPKDPTKVEDDSTRAEREADIRAREAGEKLDHVLETQDAVSSLNDAALKARATPKPSDPNATGSGTQPSATVDPVAALATDLLQTLAASVETAKSVDAPDASTTPQPDQDVASSGEPKSDEDREAEQLKMVATAGTPDGPASAGEQKLDVKAIFSVSVDDIGVYDLLKRKVGAAAGANAQAA
ncbi:hypothetical protein BJF93_04275 [Xaviernesmea oryzae]|uniref:Uncharacterized protein n=1 Tax=Xaviernesmea oryzae TaxID=464029 RepID=A0A1Q9AUS4_9HYPH|nr:hypothetical protein [Xaviernesmea oryzae]OLP59138.1 hypothetical protein BJF93_04275 [Xaviernesmea oryzae]SEK84982.1 hypothetical protein SAMN04487976_104187 [Xaviernesmea oryzae]